jgi:hypothetical protein
MFIMIFSPFCYESNQNCDVEKTCVVNRIKFVIHEW